MGNTYVPKIWKNGQGTFLTSGTNDGEAFSVFVSGSDVYVAGSEQIGSTSYARLWKNGVMSTLSAGINASAQSVSVLGTDVYVAGYEYGTTNRPIAVYWKNGSKTQLTNGTNYAGAYSIFVK